jgi:hypothetical protein
MKNQLLRKNIKSLCCNSKVRTALDQAHRNWNHEIYYCLTCGKRCFIKYIS